jgi:hypothetical protein
MTDVGLTDEFDLPAYPRHINGLEAKIQQAELAMRLFGGEAQQDESWELSWLDWLGRKPTPVGVIRAALRDRLERVGFEVPELTVNDPNHGIDINGRLELPADEGGPATLAVSGEMDARMQTVPAVTVNVVEGGAFS